MDKMEKYFALPISRRLPVVVATNHFSTSYCETGNQAWTYLENVISQFVQSLFFIKEVKNHLKQAEKTFLDCFFFIQIFMSPSPLSDDVLQNPGDGNPASDYKLVPRIFSTSGSETN